MRYVIRRLLQSIPVLLLASIPVFLVIHIAPGDPALMLLGVEAPKETIAAMRTRLGLDLALHLQYWNWITGIVVGDFGRSVMTDFSVSDLLLARFPATFALAIVSIALASVVALPLGLLAALNQGRWFDLLTISLTSLAIAIPNFWLGILLVIVFSLVFDLLPAGGYVSFFEDPERYLKLVILPSMTLALYVAASLTRFVRASMIEVLVQDYVRTAYSKGLRFRNVIVVHALRNALIPAVTVLGVQFGRLLAGTVIVEAIFAWPGLGQLMLTSINNRDYPVVQGTFLVFVLLVLITNLATDLAYSLIDPRIRMAE